MLIAVVLAFICCNILAFALNILENLDQVDVVIGLTPWSNLLVIVSASTNIFIYYIFSDRYRHLLFVYCISCYRRNKGTKGDDIAFQPVLSSL